MIDHFKEPRAAAHDAIASMRREKRVLNLGYRRTSAVLETEVWDLLQSIADAEHMPIAGLCKLIDARRYGAALPSALSLFALCYLRYRADRDETARRSAASGLHEADRLPRLGDVLDAFEAQRKAGSKAHRGKK